MSTAAWKPMRGAPIDGSPVLLLTRAHPSEKPLAVVAHWSKPVEAWRPTLHDTGIDLIPLYWTDIPEFPSGLG